ncbi:hypothetical protein [Pseudonocardia sp. KRD291]|uniref:hypothetical protein n=1 Tax=Pseudonocardia sp. KRD291 TaxID=2792007 RepID=UPI001C4A36AC|nr:hypothetical protein [Pseudonocardia sp. KRD291]MBW0105132.1 hypothetical protein [Pseudonocardia sp. KRD291]
MLVDFRPHTRLRGSRPVDIGTSVVPVLDALSTGPVDLGKVRVVADWVQYKENFRDVVDLRPILHVPRTRGPAGPVPVPSRRCPVVRATPATPTPPATSSMTCPRSGTASPPAAHCPTSSTSSSSGWATAARPRSSWTPSATATAAPPTTSGCTTASRPARTCPRAAGELAASLSAEVEELPGLVHKLLRLGPALLHEAVPQHVPDVDSAVEFWRRTWPALRLQERYVPLAGLDTYPASDPTLRSGNGAEAVLSGELLGPMLESGADVRMHVSNGAVTSFVESLRLLHPYGTLVCHDLSVTPRSIGLEEASR